MQLGRYHYLLCYVPCICVLLACDDAAESGGMDAGQLDSETIEMPEDLDALEDVDSPQDVATESPLPLKADGEPCADGSECENTCYVLPMFGGTCGECASDSDCDGGGCNLPTPTTPPAPP